MMNKPQPQYQTPPTAVRIPNLIGRYSQLGPQQGLTTDLVPVAAASTALGLVQTGAFAILNIPKPTVVNNNQFVGMDMTYNSDSPDGISKLNTGVFGKIILGEDGKENRWTDQQGNEGSYQTVELDCAIVDIQFNKNVVKTEIQGLNQSIKEYISSGDRSITITGRFDSTPGVAPIDFIQNMNRLFNAPVPIPVSNYYLNINNIYYIVIMPGTRMWQTQAGYSSQEFTIEAVSDVPMTEMLP